MPESKTLIVEERRADGTKHQVGVVTISAEKIVLGKVSQYVDLRVGDGATVATLTWPSKYSVREV